MSKRILFLTIAILAVSASGFAQTNGQPASDVLGAEDLAGNPTFIGGVSNGGATSHGIW